MKLNHLLLTFVFSLIATTLLSQSSPWPTYKLQYSKHSGGKTQILKPGDDVIVRSANLDRKRQGTIELIMPEGLMVSDVWIPLDQIILLKRLHPARKNLSLGSLATAGGMIYINRQVQHANQGGSNHIVELMTAVGLISGGLTAVVQSVVQMSRDKLLYKREKNGNLDVVPWRIGPISPTLEAKDE